MARKRTGTLEFRQGKGFFLRVTVDVVVDGLPKTERRWIDLETQDKARAQRMKKKIVDDLNAGRIVADAKSEVKKPASPSRWSRCRSSRRRSRRRRRRRRARRARARSCRAA